MPRTAMNILDLEHEVTKVMISFMNIGHIIYLRGATFMNTSSWYPLRPIHTLHPPLGDPLLHGKCLISSLVSESARSMIHMLPLVRRPQMRPMLTLVILHHKV